MATVKRFGSLRRFVATPAMTIAGLTIRQQLQNLCAGNHPLRKAIFAGDRRRPHIRIKINGHDSELAQGLATSVTTKSPLTGTVSDANSGGWWGVRFKRTGYDALVVRGKADRPSMIEITPAGVTLQQAEHLWGKTIQETTAALGQNNNKRHVLAINLTRDEIIPIDNEYSYLLHRLPVVAAELSSGSPEMAKIISEELQRYKLIMIRGHGSFAIGQTLDEALQWTSAFKMGCNILYKLEKLGGEHIEFRKQADSYSKW